MLQTATDTLSTTLLTLSSQVHGPGKNVLLDAEISCAYMQLKWQCLFAGLDYWTGLVDSPEFTRSRYIHGGSGHRQCGVTLKFLSIYLSESNIP